MAIAGALIVVGFLVALILLFAFYIFPNIICGSWNTGVSANTFEGETKDPIGELCQAIGDGNSRFVW